VIFFLSVSPDGLAVEGSGSKKRNRDRIKRSCSQLKPEPPISRQIQAPWRRSQREKRQMVEPEPGILSPATSSRCYLPTQ